MTPLSDESSLIVPSITIYEVFKVVLRESSENSALQVASTMQQGRVVDLTAALAMASSMLSLKHRMPMADSIILATALEFEATLWTQDADFKNFAGVKYFPKH